MDNIYRDILAEYERRRRTAEEEAAMRKKEAYEKIPELEAIDEEIRQQGIRASKGIVSVIDGDAVSVTDKLTAAIESLREKKESLLKAAGLPSDYYAVRHNCLSCGDTGYTGKLPHLRKCDCFKQQIINIAYSQSNLTALDNENFSSFNEKLFSDIADEKKYGIKISPRENILSIRDECLKFIEQFDIPNGKNILFSGRSGLGKTFMSNCIAKELLDKGKTVLYQTAPVFFSKLNQYRLRCFSRDSSCDDDLYANIFTVDLLIIDDLGTEPPSPSKYSELFTIINARILNNAKRSCRTILSTNLGIKEILDNYTDRVFSRITGYFDMYKFIGEDIRKTKALSLSQNE